MAMEAGVRKDGSNFALEIHARGEQGSRHQEEGREDTQRIHSPEPYQSTLTGAVHHERGHVLEEVAECRLGLSG